MTLTIVFLSRIDINEQNISDRVSKKQKKTYIFLLFYYETPESSKNRLKKA